MYIAREEIINSEQLRALDIASYPYAQANTRKSILNRYAKNRLLEQVVKEKKTGKQFAERHARHLKKIGQGWPKGKE